MADACRPCTSRSLKRVPIVYLHPWLLERTRVVTPYSVGCCHECIGRSSVSLVCCWCDAAEPEPWPLSVLQFRRQVRLWCILLLKSNRCHSLYSIHTTPRTNWSGEDHDTHPSSIAESPATGPSLPASNNCINRIIISTFSDDGCAESQYDTSFLRVGSSRCSGIDDHAGVHPPFSSF